MNTTEERLSVFVFGILTGLALIFLIAATSKGASRNDSPGHWNHAAISGPNGWIIEAQDKAGVIAVPWRFFYARYPEFVALEVQGGPQAAALAVRYVGLDYRRLASLIVLWPHEARGENCVSLMRKVIWEATGHDPRWKWPDDIAKGEARTLGHKVDYQNWQAPESWLQGATKNPADVRRPAP
jgi:hypothetical protein